MDLRGYAEDGDDDVAPEEGSGRKEELGGGADLAAEDVSSSLDSSPRRLPAKSSAPGVDDTTFAFAAANSARALHRPLDPVQHAVGFNPTYDQLWSPIYGPAHPNAKDGVAQGMRNHKLGFVEDAAIEPFLFDEQYNIFHNYGYATDLSYVGNVETLSKNHALSVYNMPSRSRSGGASR